MKRIILCLSLFAVFESQAQQINPVPDYVFSNKMSVGRNAVTDTAAYFSIGPRYGAIRGMMPPMVTDTASMSATKRNGLLIFSIQKNKYLYWDSVGAKWAEMAGTAGSAITGSGVGGYMSEFTTGTNIDTTRLYHSAGRFAIGSTTTTNGVFNVYGGQSYFDTSLKVGSQTFFADESKNEVYINTTGDSGAYRLQVNGAALVTSHSMPIATFLSPFADNSIYITNIGSNDTARTLNHAFRFRNTSGSEYSGTIIQSVRSASSNATRLVFFTTESAASSAAERVRIDHDGNMGIGTPGNYYAKLQVNSSGTGARDVLILENTASAATGNGPAMIFAGTGTASMAIIRSLYESSAGTDANLQFLTRGSGSVTERIRIFGNGRVFIGSTPTDGGYQLDVNGTMKAMSLSTSAPSGGSIKPWKLGEAATVSPTSPNRTIRVEIDGTVYYLHAKTTND